MVGRLQFSPQYPHFLTDFPSPIPMAKGIDLRVTGTGYKQSYLKF